MKNSNIRHNQISTVIPPLEIQVEELPAKSQEDLFISFLDAASDSETSTLVEVYKKLSNDETKMKILNYCDSSKNTALHFGANNGNVKMCHFIIEEAKRLDIAYSLVNS